MESGPRAPETRYDDLKPTIMRPAAILIAVVLLCVPTVGRVANATDTRASTTAHQAGALTVVSLNLAMREDVDRIAEEFLELEGAPTADIILLQEVVQRGDHPDVARQLAQRLGLHSTYRRAFHLHGDRSIGLALISRYPVRGERVFDLKPFALSFRSRTRIATGAVVDTPSGAVHVYNLHLDTRINLRERLEQLEAVAREVAAIDGPVVVGGDFNTNNNHWLFHTIPVPFIGRQSAGLQRFMEASGFHSAFALGSPTHDALRMQLDWLFLRGLHASTTSIQPVRMSDHHALVASLVTGD
jgi:endonuclease/exonuclease/phosphatase family metal-dependent hydrolase